MPAYGLQDVGRRREVVGEYGALLSVSGSDVDLRWLKADGTPLKSLPASLKKEHAERVKELRDAVKTVRLMLRAQCQRLDRLFLARKSWPFVIWCQRYRDHPLVGAIARSLIWQFTTGDERVDGIWHHGRIVGRDDRELGELGPETTVSLWHPIGNNVEDVLGWRTWLENNQVRQPFKQAHREVYLLTDAERHTQVYSNRFAAHVLRQHQFNALCDARGWKNQLRLMVNAEYPPASRLMPAWRLSRNSGLRVPVMRWAATQMILVLTCIL